MFGCGFLRVRDQVAQATRLGSSGQAEQTLQPWIIAKPAPEAVRLHFAFAWALLGWFLGRLHGECHFFSSAGQLTMSVSGSEAACAGSDDFRVTWQDDRNGAQTAFDTWYRRTTNSGSTWSAALRLSNATSGASYKNANGYAFPYGDYFEMAVDATGRNHLIWGEGASYSGPGGVWYTRGQ